jgi:hypothetical protein
MRRGGLAGLGHLLGNEVLALARNGVALGLSVGFAEVPGGSRWWADRQRVTRTRAELDHIAVVRVPAYAGAGVVGVRGGDTAARPTRSSWPCSAVAKGSQLGSMRNAGAYPGSGSRGEQRAKHARRPGMRPHAETDRRRRLVADHRATVGDWCAGLDKHPAHPSADLVADHVIDVAAGGSEAGPLRVLCRGGERPTIGPSSDHHARPRPLASRTRDHRRAGAVVA